jgi:hypothetical protein
MPGTPGVNSVRHSSSSGMAEESSIASSSSMGDSVQQQAELSTAQQLVSPVAAAVCEVGRKGEQKSGVLLRAARFLRCMAWEVTF